MTKKVSYTPEEKYDAFELFESKEFYAFKVSDKLFERYNKIHELAEVLRDLIDRKSMMHSYRRHKIR